LFGAGGGGAVFGLRSVDMKVSKDWLGIDSVDGCVFWVLLGLVVGGDVGGGVICF